MPDTKVVDDRVVILEARGKWQCTSVVFINQSSSSMENAMLDILERILYRIGL